jgi:hypothetical protein
MEKHTLQSISKQSVKSSVVNYIESCRLSDGGYFFARVPPLSGLDTYYAVKSLHLLEVNPGKPEDISGFILSSLNSRTLYGITGIFLTVEILNEIGSLTEENKGNCREQILSYRNKAGGFGAYENLDVEIVSELQSTYRAIKVLQTLDRSFYEEKAIGFVNRYFISDGGYGSGGHSTLATTYYALEILDLLGIKPMTLHATRDYLIGKEYNWEIQFIEDLYWLVISLTNSGLKVNNPDKALDFVLQCQRQSGGFSRATAIGIPTLEYTFYAVSILSAIGAF